MNFIHCGTSNDEAVLVSLYELMELVQMAPILI